MEVQVFDHLRVTSEGGEIELGGSKQRAVLLALVLANGAAVSSDELIDLVWGDNPPRKPNVTLRSYISHLRRLLEPGRGAGDRAQILITRAPGYAIDPQQITVDVHQFSAAANAAFALPPDTSPADVVDATAAACAYWPDEGAMPVDVAVRSIGDFPQQASMLAELHLALTIRHYRAALALGRPLETLIPLEQATTSHPTSEELIALRMTALFQAGRTADALAVFQDARRTLLDEFGLDPSPILTDLEQRILTNDASLLEPVRQLDDQARPTTPIEAAPVGRADVLDQLIEALPGPGRTLPGGAIIGPAGIGKSTLLHAVADAAARRGTIAVWGRCADTVSAATLRPWKSVLRDLLDRTDPADVEAIFGPQAHDLLLVVPELAGALDLEPSRASIPAGDDISDAITRTLQRYAERQPLVICLEDLHWADPESLVVAGHLLDTIHSEGTTGTGPAISLIATWRDTDVAAEAAQARVPRTRHLADLGRAVGAGRVDLGGLHEADIVEVFRSLRSAEPELGSIRRLAAHTGGNPLFVTELIRNDISGSFEPTETIRDAVLRRLDPLPEAAHDVLCAAALCHPSIDESMLPDLSGVDVSTLSDCLEASLAARLIEETPSQIGRYRFSHDLLAEALAAELREHRRTELHAQIGHLLEKQSAPVAEIAHHYLLGAGADASIDAATFAHKAALEAEELSDYEGAVRLIDRGLEALDLGPDAPVLRIEMLIDRAQILKFLADPLESHKNSTKAMELAVEAGEVDLAVVASIVYIGLPRIDRDKPDAEWLAYWSPPDQSVALLETCLEIMPEDHRWRSAVILALANQLFGPHEDTERSLHLVRSGLDMLRNDDRPRALCEGLTSMAATHSRTIGQEEREAMLYEAIEIATAVGHPKTELRARKGLVAIELDKRDLAAARAHVDLGVEAASRSSDPFVALQAASMQISLDLLVGDHELAEERVMNGFVTHSKFGEAVMDTFGMQYFTLAKARGDFALIIEGIKDKLEGYDGPAYGAPLASLCARSGDLEMALATLRRFTPEEITGYGEGVLQYMTPAFSSDAVADLSIDYPEVLEFAPALLAALEPAQHRMIALVGGTDFPSIGSAYRGRLFTALGDTAAAAEQLDLAIEHLEAIEARPSLIWARLAVAENQAAAGDPAAEAAAEAVRDDAVALGMEWAIDWAKPRIQQRLNAAS